MINDGWSLLGGKVPICDIKARNLNDAKQRLLGYVSQYGRIDAKGLKSFISEIEVPDLGTIDLPDFDMGRLNVTEEEKPEIEFSSELLEAQNYIVFAFDNIMDWQVVKERFGIRAVGALDSKKGYRREGTGRVLNGKALLEVLG